MIRGAVTPPDALRHAVYSHIVGKLPVYMPSNAIWIVVDEAIAAMASAGVIADTEAYLRAVRSSRDGGAA